MMQAVGVSIHSVLTLTQARDMGIRDCFGIARSAVETAINAAFISVSDASMADKAVRHMRQKRWRDLRRQTLIGNQTITISQNTQSKIDDFPGLREAFEEYTSKKGEEIRSWTPENIKERIAVISRINDRAGLYLGASTFSIYRPASELLHGTFYGVNLFWQGSRSRPTRHRAEFDTLWVTDHFVTVLSSLIFAASGAIQAIAITHKLDHHLQSQDKILAELSKIATLMGEIEPCDDHCL